MIDVRDYGARCTGRGDDTAGLRAAIEAARERAHTKIHARRVGLPRLYIPAGVCRLSGTLRLHDLSGFTIEGDGPRASQLRIDRGAVLLEMHRTSDVVLRGLTLTVGDPRAPWVGGLLEHSVGVLVRERKEDKGQAGVFTNVSFERMTFEGFHRAFLFQGNQMGDNVTWSQCKWLDNFFDIDYQNALAYNHRVIGGEFLGFVHAPEAAYDTRLASWSRASYPRSAARSRALSVRDGAVARSVAGGGSAFLGVSIIALKSTLLFGEMHNTPRAVRRFGLSANVDHWVFDNTTWEIRKRDASGDMHGNERITLVRYENPRQPSATQSAVVRVVGSRVGAGSRLVPRLALFHVAAGTRLFFLDGSRVLRHQGAVLSVVKHSRSASFVSRDSTPLAVRLG